MYTYLKNLQSDTFSNKKSYNQLNHKLDILVFYQTSYILNFKILKLFLLGFWKGLVPINLIYP